MCLITLDKNVQCVCVKLAVNESVYYLPEVKVSYAEIEAFD